MIGSLLSLIAAATLLFMTKLDKEISDRLEAIERKRTIQRIQREKRKRGDFSGEVSEEEIEAENERNRPEPRE